MAELSLSSGEHRDVPGEIDRLRVSVDIAGTGDFDIEFSGFGSTRRTGSKLLCKDFHGAGELKISSRGDSDFAYNVKIFVTLDIFMVDGSEIRVELPSFAAGGRTAFTAINVTSRLNTTSLHVARAIHATADDDESSAVGQAVVSILDSGAARSDEPCNVVVLLDESVSAQQALSPQVVEAMGLLINGLFSSESWKIDFATSSSNGVIKNGVSGGEVASLIKQTTAVNEVGWTRDLSRILSGDPAVLIVSDGVPAWSEKYHGAVHVLTPKKEISPSRANTTVFDDVLIEAVKTNNAAGFAADVEKMATTLRKTRG